MLGRFFNRDRQGERIASALYGAIVAQARQPALYSELAVPDSVSGRFEMLVLHLILLSRRLKNASEPSRIVGQGAFDLFCSDMDNSLRELGISDLKVPRRMREVGEAYFGRSAAYEPGLNAADPEALATALERIVYDGRAPAGMALALARYAIAAADRLHRQDEAEIAAASPIFADVARFVPEEKLA